MGLCFIGKRKFSRFIQEVCVLCDHMLLDVSWHMNSHWQYLEEQPGHFVTLDGKVMGKHRGKHFNWYLSVCLSQRCSILSALILSVRWCMTLCLCRLVHACVCVMPRPPFLHHRPAGKAGRDGKSLVCSWQGPKEQHHHCGILVSFPFWQSGNETGWQLTSCLYAGWGCLSSCPLLSLLHHLPTSLDRRGAPWPTEPEETVWVSHAIPTPEATQYVSTSPSETSAHCFLLSLQRNVYWRCWRETHHKATGLWCSGSPAGDHWS